MSLRKLLCHTFNYSWEECAVASWMKWPHPDRPDVLSVDLINKHFDPETQTLKTTRLVIMRGILPTWIQTIIGSNICFFVEQSVMEPRKKRMVLQGRNITYGNIIEMDETCVYTPEPQSPTETRFEQQAAVKAHTFGVGRSMESFVLERFVGNCSKGREIMEQTLRKVKKELF
ncbi:PRELI/MSF1 domain-containing protein [Balamuthia mandrillaris]